MDFKVLQKPFEYENCPIVIRQAGQSFEYITCIDNQIYSSFIIARKSLFKRLFGLSYTHEELHKITNYMIAMAQATINTVKGIQPKEGDETLTI